jgi:hypothetical protein
VTSAKDFDLDFSRLSLKERGEDNKVNQNMPTRAFTSWVVMLHSEFLLPKPVPSYVLLLGPPTGAQIRQAARKSRVRRKAKNRRKDLHLHQLAHQDMCL